MLIGFDWDNCLKSDTSLNAYAKINQNEQKLAIANTIKEKKKKELSSIKKNTYNNINTEIKETNESNELKGVKVQKYTNKNKKQKHIDLHITKYDELKEENINLIKQEGKVVKLQTKHSLDESNCSD